MAAIHRKPRIRKPSLTGDITGRAGFSRTKKPSASTRSRYAMCRSFLTRDIPGRIFWLCVTGRRK
uniref:Uncharacterized protein n=1 Tax=Siphoviridae sp. ctsAY3 TaxID=2827281 RepID=A0A8S5R2U5_9CAUD|nr:MAG TPA: hypothetical protein [Siphoviridae sp. ctsAY3]